MGLALHQTRLSAYAVVPVRHSRASSRHISESALSAYRTKKFGDVLCACLPSGIRAAELSIDSSVGEGADGD
jgi:hypothetical protein